MYRLLAAVILGLTLLTGCSEAEAIPEPVYFSDVVDASVDYGIAYIPTGDLSVLVPHTLGDVPDNIAITIASDPGAVTAWWVDGPTAINFRVEINAILGDDLYFYWRVEK